MAIEETAVEDAERWRVAMLDINGLVQRDGSALTFRFARAYRERLRNASIWRLELRKVHLRPRRLEMEELYYTQGRLTGARTFRLLR